MDGVVADFKKAMYALNPGATFVDTTTSEEDQEDDLITRTCLANPNIFHDLDPIPGAIEAVRELSELYETHFLSTPLYDLPESYAGKRIWLEKYFGNLAKKKLTLTHHKHLSIGEYLIDDRKKHGAGKFPGKHIHIFTDPEFLSWDAAVKYLKEQHYIRRQ